MEKENSGDCNMNVTDEVFRFSSTCEGEKIIFQMNRGSTLPDLLKNFKHFLNASGFEYVKVIEAKDDSGNYWWPGSSPLRYDEMGIPIDLQGYQCLPLSSPVHPNYESKERSRRLGRGLGCFAIVIIILFVDHF